MQTVYFIGALIASVFFVSIIISFLVEMIKQHRKKGCLLKRPP